MSGGGAPAETYYAGLAERSEAWTTASVAAFLSRVRGRETSPGYADVWLRRHGIPALGREPGRVPDRTSTPGRSQSTPGALCPGKEHGPTCTPTTHEMVSLEC